jgi:hypothetical protein
LFFLLNFYDGIHTSIYYNQHLHATLPPHTPGHIIDWDPNLGNIDQNLVCELKISMSPIMQG